MSDHAMGELTALYALDALERGEGVAFESHLADCDSCRREVADYQEAATRLVADEPASDVIWSNIRAAISERAEQPTVQPHVVPLERRTDSATIRWKWVSALAAAAAVVFGGILATQLLVGPSVEDQIVSAADAISGETDSLVGEFLVDQVSIARVVLGADGKGYVIPTDELEALDTSRTYQLWVINDTEDVISAGILGAAPTPSTFTWTGDVAGFALTREVAGGVVSSAGDVVSVITDV